MTPTPGLHWLPEGTDWRPKLMALRATPDWDTAVALANHRLDFLRTNQLDEIVRKAFPTQPKGLSTRPVRLAILGSATMAHLHAGIRIAALRRGIHVTTYENDYGQYLQELMDETSALYAFKPTVILLALDPYHLTAGANAALTPEQANDTYADIMSRIEQCWTLARAAFACPILHQTPLPVHPEVLGSNEQRLPGGAAALLARIAAGLRPLADEHKVDLLAIDSRAARDGLAAWHDAGMWHRAKQEVSTAITPVYGDLVARLLAAHQGRSAKCLVLDLDNTLWGGVIGDDGMEGIALGQGSALGEGFVAVQTYARELARRGVILAVCSKNDEANALEPFEKHPEMVLRRGDIACFIANWQDKASNIKAIARELNIGIDSLVFLDDNPFERNLVRQELPMVGVPEVPDDPALVPMVLADAGYFEGLAVTDEDRERTQQYQVNRAREELRASSTDMEAYLRGLEMELIWRPVDRVGLQRTVQLINKTNQFNLTTRRYTEDEVVAVMQDNRSFALQLRLTDKFGDNGIISIVIGRMQPDDDLLVDTWLMSCRVLGRQVEPTTLNLVAEQAKLLGAKRVIGEFFPTKKNAMVRDHFPNLGFDTLERAEDGTGRFALDMASFIPAPTFITVTRG
jgi:FkbH-like protein